MELEKTVSERTKNAICNLYGINIDTKSNTRSDTTRVRLNTDDDDVICSAKIAFAKEHDFEIEYSKNKEPKKRDRTLSQ